MLVRFDHRTSTRSKNVIEYRTTEYTQSIKSYCPVAKFDTDRMVWQRLFGDSVVFVLDVLSTSDRATTFWQFQPEVELEVVVYAIYNYLIQSNLIQYALQIMIAANIITCIITAIFVHQSASYYLYAETYASLSRVQFFH